MQIDIQAQSFSLTDALQIYTKRRLRYAFACCDDRIQRVFVRLSDINGPRGGKDKCCRLQIVLAGLPDVIVEDIEVDLYIAIARAIERAGRTVVRKIDRQKSLIRQRNLPEPDTQLLD